MAIETTCGGCGKQLSVGDEYAGRRARCPACGQIYTIPSPSDAPPDLPPLPALPQSTSDSFAETTAGSGPETPRLPDLASGGPENVGQFWMRSTEGAEYGPADRATLNRWFNEGRVGPGYMIRQSETGMWESAEIFKPSAPQAVFPTTANSSNPYAGFSSVSSSTTATYGQMFAKPDVSGLVLAFGILSWFVCPIFGVVAWIMGNTGLHDIRLGLVDPSNKGLMQAGYYLGMVSVIIWVFCGSGLMLLMLLGQ